MLQKGTYTHDSVRLRQGERESPMTAAENGQVALRRYEIVETVLRRNIASGRLPRGLVLLEGPIAAILQTSRAPVQRALQTLEAEDLVHRFEGRGFLVGPVDTGIAPIRRDLKEIGLETSQDMDTALQSRGSWERIYDQIEGDVAACVVFGQYRLVEAELARHFHVSRTVVRDVLARLQHAGLVHKDQSSHWIAGPLTAQSIKDNFALRKILEPPALIDAVPHLDRPMIGKLLDRLRAAEEARPRTPGDNEENLEAILIDTCVLTTPNERLAGLIRDNLLPILATHRLLRELGLPQDGRAISEQRMIAELLLQEAIDAAASMLSAHIDAAAKRTLAQMKIVAVISEPSDLAPYLARATW